MTAVTFPARVGAKAQEIKPARALLTVAAAPFYLLGLLVGVLWVVAAWAYAAVLIGVGDARKPDRGAG